MSVLLPIPAGCFSPIFSIGGVLGHIMVMWGPAWVFHNCGFSMGEIATVTATALAAGVTRTMASAVIVMSSLAGRSSTCRSR